MEAGELIVGVLADMRGESSHCTGVSGKELGECLQVALCRRGLVSLTGKRLEGAQSLSSASQHQLAHRSAPKVPHLRRQECADANTGAELLVGNLQPCCDVDGVAVGRVIEEPATTEVADDRGPGMNADPCGSKRDAVFGPALAERLGIFIQGQCAINRAVGMVGLLARGAEQYMQGIAHDLC